MRSWGFTTRRSNKELWTTFAKTGTPKAEDVPEWEAFTEENGMTMVLDSECYLASHHDDELLEMIMKDR